MNAYCSNRSSDNSSYRLVVPDEPVWTYLHLHGHKNCCHNRNRHADSGSGTYERAAGDGTITGTITDSGSSSWDFDLTSTSQLAFGAWVSSGTGTGNNASSSGHTLTGSGDYVYNSDMDPETADPDSSWETSGTIEESGYGNRTANQTWEAAIGSNGEWQLVSGNGTGSAVGGSSASYLGDGTYAYQTEVGSTTGTTSESGDSSDSYSFATTTTWDGSGWAVDGTGSGSASSTSGSTFSGDGTYSYSESEDETDPDATPFSRSVAGTTSESGLSTDTAESEWAQELDSDGNWVLVSGTGTGTRISSTNGDFEGTGTYDYEIEGGQVAGTLDESGISSTSDQVGTDSVVVNNEWVTTGTGTSTANDSSTQSFDGAGSWDISESGIETGTDEDGEQFHVTYSRTSTGEVFEDGSTDLAGEVEIQTALNADGEWETVSGTSESSVTTVNNHLAGNDEDQGLEGEATYSIASGTVTLGGAATQYSRTNLSSDHVTQSELDENDEWQNVSGFGIGTLRIQTSERTIGDGTFEYGAISSDDSSSATLSLREWEDTLIISEDSTEDTWQTTYGSGADFINDWSRTEYDGQYTTTVGEVDFDINLEGDQYNSNDFVVLSEVDSEGEWVEFSGTGITSNTDFSRNAYSGEQGYENDTGNGIMSGTRIMTGDETTSTEIHLGLEIDSEGEWVASHGPVREAIDFRYLAERDEVADGQTPDDLPSGSVDESLIETTSNEFVSTSGSGIYTREITPPPEDDLLLGGGPAYSESVLGTMTEFSSEQTITESTMLLDFADGSGEWSFLAENDNARSDMTVSTSESSSYGTDAGGTYSAEIEGGMINGLIDELYGGGSTSSSFMEFDLNTDAANALLQEGDEIPDLSGGTDGDDSGDDETESEGHGELWTQTSGEADTHNWNDTFVNVMGGGTFSIETTEGTADDSAGAGGTVDGDSATGASLVTSFAVSGVLAQDWEEESSTNFFTHSEWVSGGDWDTTGSGLVTSASESLDISSSAGVYSTVGDGIDISGTTESESMDQSNSNTSLEFDYIDGDWALASGIIQDSAIGNSTSSMDGGGTIVQQTDGNAVQGSIFSFSTWDGVINVTNGSEDNSDYQPLKHEYLDWLGLGHIRDGSCCE